MKLNDLVGFQLVELNNEQMKVRKNNELYTIDFDCYEGDCCGYSSVDANLLIDKADLSRNPIITKIVNNENEDGSSESVLITLFGEYKPIAEISAVAGSGSGWGYGAAVTLKCKPLEIDEGIVSW